MDDLMLSLLKIIEQVYNENINKGGKYRKENVKLIKSSIKSLENEKYLKENINKDNVDYEELKSVAVELKQINKDILKIAKDIDQDVFKSIHADIKKYVNISERTSYKDYIAHFLLINFPFILTEKNMSEMYKLLDMDINITSELKNSLLSFFISKEYSSDEDNNYVNLKEYICTLIWFTVVYNERGINDLNKLNDIDTYIRERSKIESEKGFDRMLFETKSIKYASNNYVTSLFEIIYNYYNLSKNNFDVDVYKESTKVVLSFIDSSGFNNLEFDEIARLIYYFYKYNRLDVILNSKTYSFKDLTPIIDKINRIKNEEKSDAIIDRLLHDIASGKINIALNEVKEGSVKKIKNIM